LKGGDILFRTENSKEYAVVTADGSEFLYLENHWKYRNYSYIKNILSTKDLIQAIVLERIIYYIFFCSKNSISSIIWIPSDISIIDSYLKTKNRLFRKDISITNFSYENTITRLLSSDGASIIDTNGNLRYYGCIINTENIQIAGVKGTGESAALALASNGVAIKISQDGTIKLFISPDKDAIYV
jgi:hypothetical protein